MIAKEPNLLSVFDKPQRDALAVLFLRLHDHQVTAAEILWGVWLFPLAVLVYNSGFLPRFLGVWLGVNGLAYVMLSLTGLLVPESQDALFLYAQPAFLGEIALMLWLLIKGASPRPAPGLSLGISPELAASARAVNDGWADPAEEAMVTSESPPEGACLLCDPSLSFSARRTAPRSIGSAGSVRADRARKDRGFGRYYWLDP